GRNVTGVQTCALPICHGRRGGGAPGLTPPRYSRTVEVPVLRPGPVPSAGGKWAVAGMRVVGMKDVARHAGVSVGTVSNVLNRPEIGRASCRGGGWMWS